MSPNDRLTLVSAVVLLLGVSNAWNVAQAETWQELMKSGEVADVNFAYGIAVAKYSQALKLVPPQDENSIVNLKVLLATDLVHLNRMTEAEPLTEEIIEQLPKLQASHKLQAEVMENVHFLYKAYESVPETSAPMAVRRQLWNKYRDVTLQLLDVAVPNQDEAIRQRLNRARGEIYFGQGDNCEKVLLALVARAKKSSSKYYSMVRLDLAAVQWALKKPQLINELTAEITRKSSELDALKQTSDAHFWAANYKQSEDLLNKALNILSKKRPRDIEAEAEIYDRIAKVHIDRGVLKDAEPYLRRKVELLAFKGKENDEYLAALSQLIWCLQREGKTKEADALQKTIPKSRSTNFNWLFEDEKAKPPK